MRICWESSASAANRVGLKFTLIKLIASIIFSCHALLAQAQDLRIEHVQIRSPERAALLRDVIVEIRDGRIAAISNGSANPKPMQTIDGNGLYLVPGLIDSHVHTDDLPGLGPAQEKRHDLVRALREQEPRSYLYYGFTTVVDVIGTPQRKRDWDAHRIHPDFYFRGGVPIPGGYPQTYQSKAEQVKQYPYMIVELGDEASAPDGLDPKTHTPAAVVAHMKADGAICVKTFYERGFGETDDWPAPRLDTIQALVKAAHAEGLPVLIHANSTDGQEFAVKAGVDIAAHGMWHWNREQEATELTPRAKAILDSVLAAKMGWQPTMRVLHGELDVFDPSLLSSPEFAHAVPLQVIEWYRSEDGQWFHDAAGKFLLPKEVFDSGGAERLWTAIQSPVEDPLLIKAMQRGEASMRYMAERKARVLFGSDTPGVPSYSNQPGLNGWREMHLLLRAGLSPEQIFRAATLANADALGLNHEIGTVEVGKRANLLLLREDPAITIEAYTNITKVILGGKVLAPETLAANRPSP